MAIWQYQFRIIPKIKFVDLSKKSGVKLDWEKNESDLDWTHVDDFNRLKDELSRLLPIAESWCDDLKIFGDLESDCIEIFDENSAKEISVRLDIRKINTDFILQLLKQILLFDCLIWSESSGDTIEPKLDLLKNDILKSPAKKFINDPKLFLKNLKSSGLN